MMRPHLARLHARQRGADGVEGRRQVDRDDLRPTSRPGTPRSARRYWMPALLTRMSTRAEAPSRRPRPWRRSRPAWSCRRPSSSALTPNSLSIAARVSASSGGIAEAVDHDVRALLGERAGDGEADAAGRAGDERRCVFEDMSIKAPDDRRKCLGSGRAQAICRTISRADRGRRCPMRPSANATWPTMQPETPIDHACTTVMTAMIAHDPARHAHDHARHADATPGAGARRICRERGLRLTPIRRRCWRRSTPTTARSAPTISSTGSPAGGRQALAPISIYRALDFLVEHGLRAPARVPQRLSPAGTAMAPTSVVAFLICEACGGVDEDSSPAMTQARGGARAPARQFSSPRIRSSRSSAAASMLPRDACAAMSTS